MNDLEKNFYKEVQANINDFAQYAIDNIRGEREGLELSDIKDDYNRICKLNLSETDLKSLEKIIKDAIMGAIHSTFVSIDGGTALSDKGKALDLVDYETGKSLADGALHESFMSEVK